MAKLSIEQLKKLAAIEIMAEVNDNFDILGVINKLIYVPNAPAPAWTDGKGVFISDSFFTEFTVPQMYFVLNHEFDHIYYRHHNRMLGRGLEHYVVNIATDLIINEILETRDGLPTPENGVDRHRLEKELGQRIVGKNSEDVYNEILEKLKEKNEEDKKKQQEKGDSDGESEDGEQQQGGSQSGSNQPQDGQSGKPKPGEGESGEEDADAKDIAKQLDKILGAGKGQRYKDEIDAQQQSIKQSEGETLTQEDIEKIEAIKERIEAKKGTAGKRDSAELERGYVPPKIDWKAMLRRFLGRYLKRTETRNYARPTNRYDDILPASKVVLPSMRGYVKTPKINLYLDTSGSMSNIIGNVRQILTEAKRYFKQYSAKYYEFDMQVYEFSKEEFFGNEKADGGGTDVKKVLNHYIQDKKADLGILITDGEDEFASVLNAIDKPTLILTNNKSVKTDNKKVTVVITDFE